MPSWPSMGPVGVREYDLDPQLEQQGVDYVIVIGPLTNTCGESTARFPVKLAYHVAVVPDATVAFSAEHMHAAHVLNAPPLRTRSSPQFASSSYCTWASVIDDVA